MSVSGQLQEAFEGDGPSQLEEGTHKPRFMDLIAGFMQQLVINAKKVLDAENVVFDKHGHPFKVQFDAPSKKKESYHIIVEFLDVDTQKIRFQASWTNTTRGGSKKTKVLEKKNSSTPWDIAYELYPLYYFE